MKTPKLLAIAVAICITSVLFGQTVHTVVKGEKHVNVKGTQVFLEPPAGFENAATFLGFQNGAFGASVMVVQVSGPYHEVIQGFSAERMKQKGMTLLEKEAVLINNQKGQLLTIRQFFPAYGAEFLKYSLILNLATNGTLIINGNFPESQKDALAKEIRQSVLSVVYDKTVSIDAFSSLDFTIDLTGTRYKQSDKAISGSLILEGPNKEFMMVGKSVRSLNASDKKGASIVSLKSVRLIEYLNLVEGKEIRQDGAEGYQVVANVKANGKPSKALQVILFGENYYYVLFALLSPGNDGLASDFEKILKSFKRK